MDYNQVEWSIVRDRLTFPKASLKRLPYLLIIFILLLIPTYLVSRYQQVFATNTLFLILGLFMLLMVFVINLFWHFLSQKMPQQIIEYKLDEKGLYQNSLLTHEISQLNTDSVKSTLSSKAIPYEQWSKDPSEHNLSLTLATAKGTITLYFSKEYDRQKFIRSLSEHFAA